VTPCQNGGNGKRGPRWEKLYSSVKTRSLRQKGRKSTIIALREGGEGGENGSALPHGRAGGQVLNRGRKKSKSVRAKRSYWLASRAGGRGEGRTKKTVVKRRGSLNEVCGGLSHPKNIGVGSTAKKEALDLPWRGTVQESTRSGVVGGTVAASWMDGKP